MITVVKLQYHDWVQLPNCADYVQKKIINLIPHWAFSLSLSIQMHQSVKEQSLFG